MLWPQGEIDPDPDTQDQSEIEVRLFEIRLLSALGGTPYQAVIKKTMDRVERELLLIGQKIGDVYCTPDIYDAELDRIFGKALSVQEMHNRMDSVTIDATHRLLEARYAGAELEEKKREFARSFCHDSVRVYLDTQQSASKWSSR